jgi:hypothetical protein
MYKCIKQEILAINPPLQSLEKRALLGMTATVSVLMLTFWGCKESKTKQCGHGILSLKEG